MTLISSIKYGLFKYMHDYPVDVWIMWSVLILTIFALVIKLYYNLIDESEIHEYIMRL